MEYLVHTGGEVTTFQNKSYVINAKSEADALEIAKENFGSEFNCEEFSVLTQTYTRKKRAVFACILMIIAIIIACIPFDSGWWIFKTKQTFLKPNLESCLWAIGFYSIFVIRFKGIKRTVATPLDIVMCVLTVLLLSTLFSMLLDAPSVLGLEVISPVMLLVIACIGSLLGVKLVSAICLSLVIIIAVSNISLASNAMDLWGVVYAMCSFVGVLLYLSVEPSVLEALPQVKKSFSKTLKTVKNDFVEAGEEGKVLTKTIMDKLPK